MTIVRVKQKDGTIVSIPLGASIGGTTGPIESRLSALETYVLDNDDAILGLEVDFENNKFTRLCGAKDLKPGPDFDKFRMYGDRRRCNVDDAGKILNFFGDSEVTPYRLKLYKGIVKLSDRDDNNYYYKDIYTPIYYALESQGESAYPTDFIPKFELQVDAGVYGSYTEKAHLEPGVAQDFLLGGQIPVSITAHGIVQPREIPDSSLIKVLSVSVDGLTAENGKGIEHIIDGVNGQGTTNINWNSRFISNEKIPAGDGNSVLFSMTFDLGERYNITEVYLGWDWQSWAKKARLYGTDNLSGNWTLVQDMNISYAEHSGGLGGPVEISTETVFRYYRLDFTQMNDESKVYVHEIEFTGIRSDYPIIKDDIYMYSGVCTISSPASLPEFTLTAYTDFYSYYEETGFHGQVMVYQPKFYYQILPIEIGTDTNTGIKYLKKVRYYISDRPRTGFKLHPAFIDENGNERDYILYGAYEATLWNGAMGPIEDYRDDLHELNLDTDMLCSIADLQPISGQKRPMTKVNFEKVAQNRGEGWHIETIETLSAQQLLMMIEYGKFNMQEAIGVGVTMLDYVGANNGSVYTGSTKDLGHKTGMAYTSKRYNALKGTDEEFYNGENGKLSISYRGVENPWGNMNKCVNKICSHLNEVYLTNDYIAQNGTQTGLDSSYRNTHIPTPNYSDFIYSFIYDDGKDWMFVPAALGGSSAFPVGDRYAQNGSSWKTTVLVGGGYSQDSGYTYYAGPFCFSTFVDGEDTFTSAGMGARLVYLPKGNSEEV